MRHITITVALAAALALTSPATIRAKEQPTAAFTLVNVEYEGSKLWLPGTITVKKGTKVTIKLVNNVPSGDHGFQIPAFGVTAVVKKGEPATVEFTADKAGVFPMSCQLHPAHVGGQLVVQP
ncbi:MAG: cupredoxin domain-containing protein [Candidatus Binatia bacterium]